MRTTLTRRGFLKSATAAGGSLMLGAYLPLGSDPVLDAAGTFEPNVWIRITAGGLPRVVGGAAKVGRP